MVPPERADDRSVRDARRRRASPHESARARPIRSPTNRSGDAALTTYPAATDDDRRLLRTAIELSRRCPASDTAFSVGAVVVGATGEVLGTGYSRETDAHVHAEEAALAKLGTVDVAGATIYSSLEPCGARASRPTSCASLIAASGIRRVVFALREPSLFVEGCGAELLVDAGVEVVELAELGGEVREVNGHLFGA
ncbi:MAG: dCMP deaminase [Streptosporangiales bacterium]|nr:dCMP deaminase [Streptosporangiales bacterium]